MTKQTEKSRNEGIELFRCFSMFLIVLLHVLGQGGVISYSKGASYQTAWFLETIGFCSVNCYALISGFVNKDRELKLRRFVFLWLEVFFWLLIPLVVAKLFFPSVQVDSEIISGTFLPITTKTFWYFNAYALLFPFIPIMNVGLEKLSKGQHLTILGFLFALSCTHVINGADNFVLSSGYSAMWLIMLYVFGAYFRIHGIPKKASPWVTAPLFFMLGALAWWLKMHGRDLVNNGIIEKDSDIALTFGRFVQYTSPFMLLMSICALLFFAQIKFKFGISKKIVVLMGKCSFGVYLFHVGPIMWQNWMSLRFKAYASLSPVMLACKVLLTTLVLYLVFTAFSVCRYLLFKYCGINSLVNITADKINKLFKTKKDEESNC